MIKTFFAALLVALAIPPAHAGGKPTPPPPPDHWVGTWTTANYAGDGARGSFGTADRTYREIVRVSLGGPLVRVTLTNEFGVEPLVIGRVHMALAGTGGDINLVSANAMTFNGRDSITIPPGAVAVSDPAALALPAGADLAITIFIPKQTISRASFHGGARTTSYTALGDVVNLKSLPAPSKYTSWCFLKSVDVLPLGEAHAVVAYGDSITDGAASTLDGNDRWPDVLARRLRGNKKTANLSVLNAGIGGNLLLHNGTDPRSPGLTPPPAGTVPSTPGGSPRAFGTGPSALSRFDAQVLALPGVKFLIFLEGINDIGRAENPNEPSHDESADDMIQGYVQIVSRAHAHGIKVFLATLTPYEGAKYATPGGEAIRKAVNGWIRSNKLADGVVDFDAALRDKSHPDAGRVDLLSPDHLHPSPAGYKAMGEAIDLSLFTQNKIPAAQP